MKKFGGLKRRCPLCRGALRVDHNGLLSCSGIEEAERITEQAESWSEGFVEMDQTSEHQGGWRYDEALESQIAHFIQENNINMEHLLQLVIHDMHGMTLEDISQETSDQLQHLRRLMSER